MKDRISIIVSQSGLTKTAFAKQINVSQGFVSQLCSGDAKPSDRTIADICREFHINENWLRTGDGEMQTPVCRDTAIGDFMGKVMNGEDEDFRRRLVAVLSKLDTAEWELLEKMALKLAEENKKEGRA